MSKVHLTCAIRLRTEKILVEGVNTYLHLFTLNGLADHLLFGEISLKFSTCAET